MNRQPAPVPNAPSRLRIAAMLILVYIGWIYANLAGNGLFYIAAQRATSRLPGELVYYLGVSIAGVLIPLHLCRHWGFDLPLLPKKRGLFFWVGSIAFLLLAIPLGAAAMADQGMTLAQMFAQPLERLLAPLPIFIPTMIAYTFLWYGLMLRGWQRVFGGGRLATAGAVLASALLYGFYHITSVDELFTLSAVLDEVMITTLIGIGFGVYVVFARSLLVAFLVNWLLNWFVFTPLETFHPPLWQWFFGLLVLAVVWWLYRRVWVRDS